MDDKSEERSWRDRWLTKKVLEAPKTEETV